MRFANRHSQTPRLDATSGNRKAIVTVMMNQTRLKFTVLFLGLFAFVMQGQAAEIKHSFFVAGPDFTGIVDEDGKEQRPKY